MNKIKAIETQYKGYRFRSRLEARWAVFFDALGVEWVYEPEGYDLGEAGWYLPDFWLPRLDTWIEIKPYAPSDNEIFKMWSLAQARIQKNVCKENFFLCGTPGLPQIVMDVTDRGNGLIHPGSGYFALSVTGYAMEGKPLINFECFAETGGGAKLDIWPMYFHRVDYYPLPAKMTPVNVRGASQMTGVTMFHGFTSRMYNGSGISYDNLRLRTAYTAARSARFEHGETPS